MGFKRRICIFSFYCTNGVVNDYVLYLLKELSGVCEKIIFTVNGHITDESENFVKKYTDKIINRPNLGFDAGAYKTVLCGEMADQLINYDELILCNDTFWGPFVPMKDIFEKMKSSECDFWGLCNYKNNYCDYIPSFFYVFRESITRNNILQKYFQKNVAELADDIHYPYCQFEIGLYDFLVATHYKPGWYVNIDNIDFYKEPDVLLYKYYFPLMKRRILSKEYFSKERLEASLTYVDKHTDYDVNIILNDLKNNYHISVKDDDLNCDFSDRDNYLKCFVAKHTEEELKKYIDGNTPIFIYGAGVIGCRFYWKYLRNNKNFVGFVVSDGQMEGQKSFIGEPLYRLSELNIENQKIVVAIERSDLVIDNIKKLNYILL